ncbi:MAG: hypothetical protein F4Y80_00085 [Caldilineaceae bacterium SB0665_bin_21]|nr:hypothetical protein [Caldilineaceae bacterium SB0665_bin_21]MYA06133.1 hypothetical protein [Caldilineaceae bacterium SB0664_bin_22]MYC62846.1 hypothetical protein [Caldilineaceae bacterium SB0661_bin_34]
MFRVSTTKTRRNPHERQYPIVRYPIRSDGHRLVDDLMANPNVMLDLTRSEMALLAATHEMGFAREVANRLVFMDADEIVEMAGVAIFFENPETERAKVFQEQSL